MSAISAARKAAFQILMAVERGQSHSDDLLRGKAVNELSAPDRNLATALVLGVLRWQIRLDHQLQSLLKRPNAKLDPEILIALRLGAFQLQFLDRIPARAAIDESVELAKQAGHRFASGMVNAVLRKMAASPHSARESIALKGHDSDRKSMALKRRSSSPAEPRESMALKGHGFSRAEHVQQEDRALAPEGTSSEPSAAELALSEAHPAWMVERWSNLYGIESARVICRHGQTQPALILRLASPAIESELIHAGIQLESGDLLASARTVLLGDAAATEAFREGRIRLQDEGSQLVAELAGQGSAIASILDVCAAPGGKTLILAERHPQARIVACESSPPRLAQLSQRLSIHADRIECRLADAATLAEEAAFDLALADVPCSGTGTLGRNPEIRHRLRVEDLPRQAGRQRAILTAALRAVRIGGRVVYSTCSLEPEENEQIIAAVLAENPNVRQLSLESSIAALLNDGVLASAGAAKLRNCLTPEGALRLLPGVFHTDGFFIALLEKTA